MSDVVLSLEAVSKRYVKLDERAMLLRSLLPFARPGRSELWALRDIDLVVRQGETVGLIGRNGAGKTTLLRLLAGVTRPSAGRVTVAGRIAPLISVGVGFHPEMSGRENVYVNGMLLGLTSKQITERLDDIVSFAELERFIDTPVKFYSSGMYMRLGFSVAISADPDVLLVDEVLAVGDLAFQLRCFDRMRDIQERGATIVLVSHSMQAIRNLCPRAVVLRQGRVEYDGEVSEAIGRHHELMSADVAAGEVRTAVNVEHAVVTGGARIVERRLLNGTEVVHHAAVDETLTFEAQVAFERSVESPQLFFSVLRDDGRLAYSLFTEPEQRYQSYAAGEVADVKVRFQCRLGGGTYKLVLQVLTSDGRQMLEPDDAGLLFFVAPAPGSAGLTHLGAEITVDGHSVSDYGEFTLGRRQTP
ncbi:MAG: ABC transporter ATP-binding protein [Acidimicrobiia bacterium]|nr:ABC transporter ATP-binding protein [Acidimicrobiia bacterium]